MVMLAGCFVGAFAGPASAGTISKSGTQYVFDESDGDASVNTVAVIIFNAQHWIKDDSEPMLVPNSSGCDRGGQPETVPVGWYVMCPGASALRLRLGGGSDAVSGDPSFPDPVLVPLLVDGGPGHDTINGNAGPDVLNGGADADSISGGPGADTLDGGLDADVMSGGGARDIVSYAARSERVRVNLGPGPGDDGSANDGPLGSRDAIGSDVEEVVGGAGDDILIAGSAAVTLRGGGGNDNLLGGPLGDLLDGGIGADSINPADGADTVLAGAGVDNVDTRDGAVDTVDCGPDGDNARTDTIDSVTACQPPAPVVQRIVETRTSPSRVLVDLGYTFTATRRVTKLTKIGLEVERGAAVTVKCRAKGKRCKGVRDFARTAAAASVRLRGIEGKRLPAGAKLSLRVTKAGKIGVLKTLTMRKRRAPSVTTRCIAVGATRPSAC